MHLPTLLLIALTSSTLSSPLNLGISSNQLLPRASGGINPSSITGTTCTATGVTLNSHDINVAVLSICGGIAGPITKCGGAPQSTTGVSGTARFDLTATDAGATISISKGRWEQCVRAAQAVCGNSPFKATCIGGASVGNVAFTLSAN